jgi:hypothetical protein
MGCPPGSPVIHQRLDLAVPVYAIVNEFDLAEHVGRMHHAHPDWTQRQLECCLYWQNRARRELELTIVKFLLTNRVDQVERCPEAGGVNVTETLHRVGIELEWPPRKIVRQVALAGRAPTARKCIALVEAQPNLFEKRAQQ